MKRSGPWSDIKCRLARRGSGTVPGRRRVAGALGLAGAVLAGPATVARAASNQLVSATIYQPGSATGITRSVSLGALAQGCTAYAGPDAVLSPSLVTYVFPQSSWSLRTVLECGFNQSVAAITAVAVQKSSGAWEDPLTDADLSAAGDFAVAQAVPVVSDDGAGIVYTRPQRTPTENNAADQVIHPAALTLAVYEGPLLTVTVHPGSETVPAGTTVSFTAGVTDAHGSPVDPATLSYTWSLDGTPSSQSQGFSQTFASAGRYTITTTANDDRGGGGADTVQITVGSSQSTTPGAQNTNSPGTTQQPGATAIGPQQSAGTIPGGAAGQRLPKQTTPTSKAPAARKTPVTPARTTTVKPAAQQPAPTAPTPGAASAPHPATPVTRPARRVPPAPAGPVIAGRLISNVTLLPAYASPLVKVVPADAATAPAVERPTRASILPALAGVLAVVALLALGAANQLRWRLRPGRRLVAG